MAPPIPIDSARRQVLDSVVALPTVTVGLSEALGRVLARPVVSSTAVPPFPSSAMDGYAVSEGAHGRLTVVGESRAGHPYQPAIEAGTAIAISTGAVVPEGTGAVVPIEEVEEEPGFVTVPAAGGGAHVRAAGEDVQAGDSVMPSGAVVGPAALGVLASIGLVEVGVAAAPRVALLSTGDELTAPGTPLPPGGIYSSNGPVLAAMAGAAGAAVQLAEDVPDTATGTRDAIERSLEHADVVCVSGGVSVGPHDHVKSAFAKLGAREVFWRVALRPGKPVWFGVAETSERRVLCFGLPGNPVSCMVCFQLFVRPALRALQGADPATSRVPVELTAAVQCMPGRTHAVRCRLEAGAEGWRAAPTGPQGSHQLTSMLEARALALVPPGDGELAPGNVVEAELL
ncbi:MAG: molybdopterin molybdotransferase MoeA [Thermoleophilaceae bacterium]